MTALMMAEAGKYTRPTLDLEADGSGRPFFRFMVAFLAATVVLLE